MRLRGSLHHVDRAHDIRLGVGDRSLDALGHAHRRCLMQDIIDVRTGARTGLKILDVPFDEREILVRAQSREIPLIPRREIIKHAHAVPH